MSQRFLFTVLLPLVIIPCWTRAEHLPKDTIGYNSLIYNGTEFLKQFNQSKGNPFFSTETNKGKIKYQDNWYDNIELLYDCEDDAVITRDAQGLLKLRLIKEKTEAFFIDGHEFVKLKLVSSSGEFYEQLYKGSRTLLVQWRKHLELDAQEMPKYELRRVIFVLDKDQIITLEGSKDLFNLSPQHYRELKRIYAENKLNFKKDALKASKILIQKMEEKNW
ncbi:MAG: hypothetical protein RL131_469 [Bacteroidota bacterium]